MNKTNTRHGLSKTREYDAYYNMRARCYHSNHPGHKDYGGRGIEVCERWMESFVNFYEDMGPRPSLLHSVERKDVDGNYSPENCVWGTRLEQATNRRDNRFLDAYGRRLTISQWARELRLNPNTIVNRLRRGKSPEEALEPLKHKGSRAKAESFANVEFH